jgi:hypothetical protein
MWKRAALLAWLALECAAAHSDDRGTAATPAAAPPQAERGALVPTETRRSAELESAFPDDSIVRIGDGDDRTIGVYRQSIGDRALGVVVIVLGASLTAESVGDSTRLRHALPRGRWSTLAVALPDVPNEVLPPRQHDKLVEGAAAAQPAEPAATSQVAPVNVMPARVQARLDAAVKAAREKGRKVVVLGEDAAGVWIVWAQNHGLGADALVAINPARGSPTIDGKPPTDAFAALAAPALLLMETPHDWSADDPLGAHVTLQRLPPGDPAGVRLERRINGWLKRRFDSRG